MKRIQEYQMLLNASKIPYLEKKKSYLSVNRNMNDMEEGRYKTLCEVLDLIDEQKK